MREAPHVSEPLVTLSGRPVTLAPPTPRFRLWQRLLACLVLTLTLTGVAVIWARQQPVHFEASDTMQVGTTNASPMTVSGYAGYAQEQLASTFARLASTESFRQQTVQAAGLPSSALVSANASPQPQQPFVRVTVRATSPAAARTLLVAAEKVLAQRVRSYATRGGRPKALRRAVRAQAKLTAAEAREQTGPSIGAQAVANQAAVSAAQLRVTVTDKALGADAGITPSVVLLTSPTIHSPGIIAVGRRSWLPPVTLAAVAIGLILSTLVLLAPTLVARRSTS